MQKQSSFFFGIKKGRGEIAITISVKYNLTFNIYVCVRDNVNINQTDYITKFFICFYANVLSVSHHDNIADWTHVR